MTTFRSENVHAPAHYAGDIECIDAMVQQFGDDAVKTACVIQAFEMIWRWTKKGDPDENLEKAHWWLSFAIGQDPRSERTSDRMKRGRKLNTITGEETVIDANSSRN